ncbi:hypothetical protein FHS59_003566 [Algoriphagus iocasae]|uniref:Uncharacterized protein n=1 Tax=Algoriphagus iocasae TaxID=1836499 RepID=A0A841MM05_9BACT|nr:hypothetical protein [Algoriphagus iocasae]
MLVENRLTIDGMLLPIGEWIWYFMKKGLSN